MFLNFRIISFFIDICIFYETKYLVIKVVKLNFLRINLDRFNRRYRRKSHIVYFKIIFLNSSKFLISLPLKSVSCMI